MRNSKKDIAIQCLEAHYNSRRGSLNERITIIVFSNEAILVEDCLDYSKPFDSIKPKLNAITTGGTNTAEAILLATA